MASYNYSAIEKKWRENWEKDPINVDDGKKPKYYCLDMFPYPSGIVDACLVERRT